MNCPICSNIIVDKKCESCGFEFSQWQDGIFSCDFPNSSVAYPEDGNEKTLAIEDSSFWFRHRNRVIIHFLQRYHSGGILCDVGGGNGYQALQIQKVASQVSMVEPGYIGCLNGKSRGVQNVVHSTLQATNINANSVSSLCFFDVIEHIEESTALLKEAHRILKPAGRVFVTVPAYEFLWSDEDIYADHKRRYTVSSLKAELEASGFKLLYASYFFSFLLLPLFLFRTLPYKLGKRQQVTEMNEDEHSSSGILAKLLISALKLEYWLLTKNVKMPTGTSIFAVAEKLDA